MELNLLLIQEIIITFFDFLIFYVTCFSMFKQKRMNKIKKYSSVFILFSVSILNIMYIDILLGKILLSILLVFLMMNVLFDDKKEKIFFLVISIVIMFIVVEIALVTIIKLNTSIYDEIIHKKDKLFNLTILSRLIVFIILILTIIRKITKIELGKNQISKLIIISLLSITAIIYSIIPDGKSIFSSDYIIPIILIFNNIFIYYILVDFTELSNNLRISSINEERMNNELELWKKLEHRDNVQKKIMHDYTNTILCIRGLIHEKKEEELKEYIDNISTDFLLASNYVSTGNSLIDVLINNKYEIALSKDIALILKLDKLNDVKIKNEEMIVILSNLLDNAIEHCEELRIKRKEIFLSIKNHNSLQIIIRNPIEKEINVENDLIKTTKKGDNHGIGLTNVKDVVKAYDGEIYIDVDDGYFTYFIEIEND